MTGAEDEAPGGSALPPRRRRFDRSFRASLLAVGALGALFAALAAFVADMGVSLSLLLGAAVAVANLYAMGRILAALITRAAHAHGPGPALLGLLVLGKILALFGGMYVLMTWGAIDPLAVVLGYAVLPFGIAVGSIVGQRGAQQ